MAFSTLALRVATSRLAVGFSSPVIHAGAVCQGPSKGNRLSLTFDDGPHPKWTPLVLDCLGRLGVRATFFIVGRSASMYPELVREVHRLGHEIGTHLYWHQRPDRRAPQRLYEEIRQSRTELEGILRSPVRWVRFPYGDMGALRAAAVRRLLGLQAVYWTRQPRAERGSYRFSCPKWRQGGRHCTHARLSRRRGAVDRSDLQSRSHGTAAGIAFD
jgi:peptidoglycan/xylan/chitin deacetylase (PgdA/CDA1 family)